MQKHSFYLSSERSPGKKFYCSEAKIKLSYKGQYSGSNVERYTFVLLE
jgi:hypothetical protein